MIDIFEFDNYRSYLLHKIEAHPKGKRGVRSKLARVIGSSESHISQVLASKSHLTLEQADKINIFFGHESKEADFFFTLIQHSKASTESLKKHWAQKIIQALADHCRKSKTINGEQLTNEVVQSIFYSSWHYSAIHVALHIPTLQTVEALSKRFSIKQKTTQNILNFLLRYNFAEKVGGRFLPKGNNLFIGKDSHWASINQVNWRHHAANAIANSTPHEIDLHAQGVLAVSMADWPKIRAKLTDLFHEIRSVATKSKPSEELLLLCADLYRL